MAKYRAWTRGVIGALLLLGTFCALSFAVAPSGKPSAAPTYADLMGTTYTTLPADTTLPPRVKEIPIEIRADAIWGGTGRDASGHIWIGVSDRDAGGSAHLLEYVPDSGAVIDHGDVVSELKQAGVYRQGEGQIKIHTKIIEAQDGYLYFGSFDEEGEDPYRAVPPKWGGHLWRYKPGNQHWEHLRSTPQALVAVAGNGIWIYALGYWDHVLFQYDTLKRTWLQVRVGSIPEHVSRNFVVDRRGHAYVPRVREWQPGEAKVHPDQKFSTELVEFDTDLKEVASTPLGYYVDARSGRDSHGLIGLSYLEDGSIVISTAIGYLYRIMPSDTGAARVEALGWLHPTGNSYPSSIFPIDGNRYLAGVAQGPGGFDWFVYDLMTRKAQTQKLPFMAQAMLLYGSSTRDNQGRFYVVGRQGGPSGSKPLLLQVEMQN